ncbi:hypothetical protein [Aquibacillus saliphilus]|uniref:hypothetical protein n=1 Tax=Aquibacillus saliphilus TaxID=1909422 RepID=UPI001CF083A5|nr:hypothetical protein [Aquibacillus saliphilus]
MFFDFDKAVPKYEEKLREIEYLVMHDLKDTGVTKDQMYKTLEVLKRYKVVD